MYYNNPEDEYDVSTNADIEPTCSNCEEVVQIFDAYLEGNQWKLGAFWTCEHCGTESRHARAHA